MKTETLERQSMASFEISKEIEISAPIEIAFEAMLEQLGEESQMPGGKPFPMKIERWPGAKEVAELSAAGKIRFGEVVSRLMRAGIERYHADYSRMENTYYTADGGSCVIPMQDARTPVAEEFTAERVEAAVRQAQRGEIMYPQSHVRLLRPGALGISFRSRENACNTSVGTVRSILSVFRGLNPNRL